MASNSFVLGIAVVWWIAVRVESSMSRVDKDGSTRVEACEMEYFEVECAHDEVVVLQSAFYGRMAYGRCIDRDYGYLGCGADVLEAADRLCSGRRSCRISVPNSAFKKHKQCPKDLKPYFEASYKCIKVITASQSSCREHNYVTPLPTSGFLAKYTSLDTGQGSAHCPWIIQGKPGQTINITLWDFAVSSPMQTNSISDDREICEVYASVREKDKSRPTTVCSTSERVTHAYSSVSHAVEVRMLGSQPKDEAEYFFLRYEILGCPDFVPTDNSWVKRENNVTTVGCSSTEKRWKLVCVANEWLGELGNCTDDYTPTFGEVVWGNWFLSFEVSLVIVITIAIGIGIVILALGLICMRNIRSQRRRKNYDKPANLVQPHTSSPRPPPLPGNPPTSHRHCNGVMNPLSPRPTLPPPASFLMEHDLITATENEYAYIAEMPPPPSPSPPHTPKKIEAADVAPPPPPPPPPPPHGSTMAGEAKLKDIEWPELPEFVFENPTLLDNGIF
ncbi:hypothetical protein CAPTEDRAFT_217222 [Capitella teleta]|uniref:SUEL-type lectin domain-containing protein n=1 Tax=Capitella teleta TaxID=283909 RepID=R7U2G1_CAPTE|nr:hypothetical protein CAPTEDRAFT_217222 [Capitella teleta]|eukprot:ELT97826.1 hypothetical protein CAPTEDRAFT_217222 [Capitella teleta]